MDYARQQRDPARHAIGIAFVVLIHGLVVWALISGLGKSVVQIIKKPLDATIIDEVKLPPPPPPPPPKKIIEQPKVQQPIDTYVPPPDIPVATTGAPVISAVTAEPPKEAHVIAPPPPVVQAPPPPPPKPAIRRGITRLSGDDPIYPRAAIRAGVDKGKVLARVMIDEKGNVYEVVIVNADPPRHFNQAVIDALMGWKFHAEGEKYVGEVEVTFKLKD